MNESRRMKKLRWIHHEQRSTERLRRAFELEKRLANTLRSSTQEERKKGLYTEIYDELMSSLPDQPFHTQDESLLEDQRRNALYMLRPYLRKDAVYLEIGPGTCNVAFEVAKLVARVLAVDVSHEITDRADCPDNAYVVISDGVNFSADPDSVDIAYSNQLLEHIHEEDGLEHMLDVYRALKPGGVYICRTPNLYSGPHDISMFFCHEPPAQGLHLKEYTYGELRELYVRAGFKQVHAIVGARGFYLPFKVPASWMVAGERLLAVMPFGIGRRISLGLPGRVFLTMQLVGRK